MSRCKKTHVNMQHLFLMGRLCVRLTGGQWALCAAELTLARAGGGEDKKASCRDSMTLC